MAVARQISLKLPISSSQMWSVHCRQSRMPGLKLLRLHNSVYPAPTPTRSRRRCYRHQCIAPFTTMAVAEHYLGGASHCPSYCTSGLQCYGIRRDLSSCSLGPRKLTTGSIALSELQNSGWIDVLAQWPGCCECSYTLLSPLLSDPSFAPPHTLHHL